MNGIEKLKAIITDDNSYVWEDGMKYTMFGIFNCLHKENLKFERKTQKLSYNGYDGLNTDRKEKFEKIVKFHNWNNKFEEFVKVWINMYLKFQDEYFGGKK